MSKLMAQDWCKGSWSLRTFTTQTAAILVVGHVLAVAPIVDRFLGRVAARRHSPRGAMLIWPHL